MSYSHRKRIYRGKVLKVFTDDRVKVTQKLKFVGGWVDNVVGRGENFDNRHSLIFPQCFHKLSPQDR